MAAAFASLVSLHNTLHLIFKHPRHHFSFDEDQLGILWSTVTFLIDFMRSSDDSYGATKEAAEALESRIARAAQAAEDVIESHVVDQIQSGTTLVGDGYRFLVMKVIKDLDFDMAKTGCRINRGFSLGENVKSDLLYSRSIMAKAKAIDQNPRGSALGRDIRSRFLLDLHKAIQDMGYIWRKAVNVRNRQSGFVEKQPTFSVTTSSAPEKNRMVGFDDELHRLLDLLTGVPSSRRVISIVGMGGIGKTTLAKNAFQHKLISEHFDVCLWATVSQEFNVHKILAELLSFLLSVIKEETSLLPKTTVDVSRFGDLGIQLYKSLFGRRYLIVLDDMWSAEPWDKLKTFFPDTSNGSRIVVTTRQSNVVDHQQNWRLDMRVLDKDNSWDLFCEKTFEEKGCPAELEDIGKKIVEKCKGLPLAIVVIGGHLQKSPWTPEYWKNVANDMSSVLNHAENEECFNILSLSYRYLPVHLKPCFLFLGVFQEDEEIPVEELFYLWVGEGFIQHSKNCRMEDRAASYFMDLIGRNLISAYIRKRDGVRDTPTCRVHDLVRELCLKIAKKDGFLSAQRAMNSKRRVVVEGKFPKTDATRLVNEVNFHQVNLRFLKMSIGYRRFLPSSISLLWNLQTLIITAASASIIAPYEIWEMTQLRHIEINFLCLPDPLPVHSLDEENDWVTENLRKLLVMENLRTLSTVENLRLSEEVFRRIPSIKELKLSYCGEPSLDYCPQNLVCFEKLCFLECYFDRSTNWRDFEFSLIFPNSLTVLRLEGCRLEWEALGVKLGSLPCLDRLELFMGSAIGSEWTPVEGGFPCLNHLVIFSRDLIYWNADKSHFPVLRDIYLLGMTGLDEFPSDIGEIPTLRKIALVDCSVSAYFSAMRMVVEQEELGNEGLQLGVIFEGDKETIEGFKQKAEEKGLRSKNIDLHVNLKTEGL